MIKNYVFPNLAAGAAIAAGSTQTLATHVRCTSGNGSFEIRCYDDADLVFYSSTFQSGLSVGPIFDTREPGQRYPDGFRRFNRVEIVNGSTAQTIELYMGDGEVTDNRLVGTVNITGGILSRPIGADTLDTSGVTTLAASGSGTGTAIKTATTQGVEILIQNLGTVPALITHAASISGWTTMATPVTGGTILEPVPAGGNVGGSITLSGGIAVNGMGIGGACKVLWQATKFT